MTTIAWDGKTLAADRRAHQSGMPFTVCKIRLTADGRMVAVSGNFGSGSRMLEWLSEPVAGRSARPECQLDSDDYVDALEITEDGRCFRHERWGSFEVLDRFHAIGSGRDFAMAAMALGKTAIEAVELAATLDIGTGNGVDWLALGPA